MKQKIWLTRDKYPSGDYGVFVGRKPSLQGNMWDEASGPMSDFLKDMCPKQFHQFCNIRLRKGQCVPVKLTHLKNGFKFEVVR